jgi:hypothetical protein
MNYPVAKVLGLLQAAKSVGDEANPAYEQLLQTLLDYEQQEVQWQQSPHPTLTAQTADHARRSGNTDAAGNVQLGAGASLFWNVHVTAGYQVEITLYRPLSQTEPRLKGSALLTPDAMQESWSNTAVLLYDGDVLVDMARIDVQGDFELTLLTPDTGRFHLEFRLTGGESITLEQFALSG